MSRTTAAPGLDRIELAQGTITYRVAGPADSALPTVVFVHGLLVDGKLWTTVADALATRGIRSFAPNWPTGSHPMPMKPDADLSPRGIAAIVLDFLAAHELTDVTLVGNDTGGAICQYVIDTEHRRIGRLVLTNCDAFDLFPPKDFEALVKIGRHEALLKPLLTALRPKVIRHRRNVYGGTLAGQPDADITRSWIEPGLSNRGVRRDTAKLLAAMKPDDLLAVSTRFSRFTKPVRLAWGTDDPFFPLTFGERLAAAFPNATLTPVPDASTFVSMDQPEQVADVIAS
jgi:pimeloyl-ACP methyl ester carboxylesterase